MALPSLSRHVNVRPLNTVSQAQNPARRPKGLENTSLTFLGPASKSGVLGKDRKTARENPAMPPFILSPTKYLLKVGDMLNTEPGAGSMTAS